MIHGTQFGKYLEMVRAEKHVSLTPYVMDGETEALRRNLSLGDFVSNQ